MTFTIKIKVTDASNEFIDSSRAKMAYAATNAMKDTAENAKKRGRASIAANGFSTGWQNAMRSVVYPKDKDALGPAAIIYHKIDYAEVFEQPTAIQAKTARYLWLPIPGIFPSKSANLTPRQWANSRCKLQFVETLNRALLVVSGSGKTNKSGLKPGTPVYFGVRSVQLTKKFNIKGAVQDAANGLSRYFDKRFKEDNS